ncbi:histone deacetylase 6 isoform X3 [Aethina tumida]|uniref:histone deacetylase 6 isoform X3 n=1 Tax=Aethina tumida TaxID=116153 RepID=UPI00096B41B0|nr:histone deacetylase 6 isoform X3 [Aethina tumida]
MSSSRNICTIPSPRNKLNLKEIIAQGRQRENKHVDVVLDDPYENYSQNVHLTRKSTALHFSLNQHECLWDKNHPETPKRYQYIEKRLKELELDKRCECKYITESSPNVESLILTKHSRETFDNLKKSCKLNVNQMEEECSKHDSIYMNEHTFNNAIIAVETVYNLAKSVSLNEFHNGMAIVRPPGHHAMQNDYNGYCFFNNVAITAENIIKEGHAGKILIVDYDVHHGQGTQRMFYNRKDILYFSIHRYENGNFWPNLAESNCSYIGEDDGLGYNINVPLNETNCSDSDYLAVILHILLPVAYEGEMNVTPAFYGHLISLLSGLAKGKIVVALEGGYNIDSLAEGVVMTVKSLLNDPCGPIEMKPVKSCITDTINNLKFHLRNHWNCFKHVEFFDFPKPTENTNVESSLLVVGDNEHLVSEMYTGVPDVAPFPTRGSYPFHESELCRQFRDIIKTLRQTYHKEEKSLTGYAFDTQVLLHKPQDSVNIVENPNRISRIIQELEKNELLNRMLAYTSKPVAFHELKEIHDDDYLERTLIEEQLPDTKDLYVNSDTKTSILASLGGIFSLVDALNKREISNGLALVRPPGHHAKYKLAGGFCFVNNIVAAARYAIKKHNYKRVLIIDFDVHHGDGTQELTCKQDNIMYISLHRYENGTYFPKSNEAGHTYVGIGPGKGFNVNIPFNCSKMGNSEYLLTFFNIVLPIAYSYNPDLVLVSAGYDAGLFDPLGGYSVSPETYGHLIQLLKPLSKGHMLVCLEGGYNLNTLAYSVVMTAKALLSDPLPMPKFVLPINDNAIETVRNVIQTQKEFWPVLQINKKISNVFLNQQTRDAVQLILQEFKNNGVIDKEKIKQVISDINNLQSNN